MDDIQRLVSQADDVRKAAAGRADPAPARRRAEELLLRARERVAGLPDEARRLELSAQIARRMADLDREAILGTEPATTAPDVAPAPTRVADPARVPPGQHLTAGWPVLHTGRVPAVEKATFSFTVTGFVGQRLRLSWDALRALPETTVVADLHCVTGWSRLANTWAGVRPRELLDRAGVGPGATHALVSGLPAYSANLPLEALLDDDVLLAWSHDGTPLPAAHGGPLRLVVPRRYGWKSVKWAFELRLLDRDVPGYWEARGYHNEGDPWREQRFHGD